MSTEQKSDALIRESNSEKSLDIEKNQVESIPNFTKPWWLIIIPMLSLVIGLTCICYFYLDVDAKPFYNRWVSWGSGIFFILWYCYIGIERTYYYGIAGYYEIFWFCNISLLLVGIGLVFELPSLVCCSVCVVMFPHAAYWIDIISWLICRKTPCGAATFMFESGWPIHDKISTLHHFVLIPNVLFLLYEYPYIQYPAYLLSVVLLVVSQWSCHFLTPLAMLDKNKKYKYLNVCISYELPEILRGVYPFKWTVNGPTWLFFLICFFFYAVPINGVCYGLFLGCQYVLNLSS
ncbi:hypothetical protein WA158_000184 [Blastocystis sp. Blastoise]